MNKLIKKLMTYFLIIIILITNTHQIAYAKVNNNSKTNVDIIYIDPNSNEIINSQIIVDNKSHLVNIIEESLSYYEYGSNYSIEKMSKNDLNTFKKTFSNSDILPSEKITISYFDEKNNKNLINFFISYTETPNNLNNDISFFLVETAFDIGGLALSLSEYYQNETFWNGFWVVFDAASVVLPFVPSVSNVKRMIKSSDVLANSLKKGVRKYSQLQNISAPASYMGKTWERHHIFEKRFASELGTTTNNMFSIFLPQYHYHHQVTQKMKSKLPYLTSWTYSKNTIIQKHIEGYGELWAESGFSDEVWEFMYIFSQKGQSH